MIKHKPKTIDEFRSKYNINDYTSFRFIYSTLVASSFAIFLTLVNVADIYPFVSEKLLFISLASIAFNSLMVTIYTNKRRFPEFQFLLEHKKGLAMLIASCGPFMTIALLIEFCFILHTYLGYFALLLVAIFIAINSYIARFAKK